ncbi:uroporphyrinogen-III C-methyltransferase [Denitratisoma sp. DHT3]|uniref:uroporphyrinogen-III C-methyltransferase n=1 Tax=Denitratisoma sp. DHT3 TaxID=1981880 RepID=UPI001C95C3BA|nr:uroporphyrinogen-III C-methyltransferase [Denitratisoma sp. DHT3]
MNNTNNSVPSADPAPALTSRGPEGGAASRARAPLRRPAVLIAFAALGLLGWQWLETRVRLSDLQTEVARRLAEGDSVARESRVLSRQNQEAVAALQAKLGVLEAQLVESQSQQLALDAMYQELSRGRDERLLAEIEQTLTIAAQQLQLAGNVEAALIALEGADARLARANQPQWLALRKLISRDIERLKAQPGADISGMAMKLESLIAAVDGLPFAFEQRPQPAARAAKGSKDKGGGGLPATEAAAPAWWRTLFGDLWAEARQLVRIERVDQVDPGLLAPSQTFFLRENLKLRLVNARLSLLSRDARSFREDMRQSGIWLNHYFDGRARPVQHALDTVRSLGEMDIAKDLPSLNETLDAVRNFKLSRSREALPSAPRATAAKGAAATQESR